MSDEVSDADSVELFGDDLVDAANKMRPKHGEFVTREVLDCAMASMSAELRSASSPFKKGSHNYKSTVLLIDQCLHLFVDKDVVYLPVVEALPFRSWRTRKPKAFREKHLSKWLHMAGHSRDVLHHTANETGPSRYAAEAMATVLGLAALTSKYVRDIRYLHAESEPPLAGTVSFDLDGTLDHIICSLQGSFTILSGLGILADDADKLTREMYVTNLTEMSKSVIVTSRSVYVLREYREAIRKARDADNAANRYLELSAVSHVSSNYGVPSVVADEIFAATQSVKDAVVARESAWEDVIRCIQKSTETSSEKGMT
jgi:hypothetical protein